MDTKYICGRCGGRLMGITETGTKAAKAYDRDEITRVYCQYCDEVPDAKAKEVSPILEN